MSTTTPYTAAAGLDSRETVAYLVFRAVDIGDNSRAAALETADQILQAVAPPAPTTYALPPEPGPGVTVVWDRDSVQWDRTSPRTWRRHDEPDDPWWRRWNWLRLLSKRGPLSTVPPEQTEASS